MPGERRGRKIKKRTSETAKIQNVQKKTRQKSFKSKVRLFLLQKWYRSQRFSGLTDCFHFSLIIIRNYTRKGLHANRKKTNQQIQIYIYSEIYIFSFDRTSSEYGSTAYWMLHSPTTPRWRITFSAVSRRRIYSALVSVCEGATTIESPVTVRVLGFGDGWEGVGQNNT
jgi:hypothetical protein